MSDFHKLRAAFARHVDNPARQMGLRRIRDAIALGGNNPQRVADLYAQACFLLPQSAAYSVQRQRAANSN